MVEMGRISCAMALVFTACGGELPGAPEVSLGPAAPSTIDDLVASITPPEGVADASLVTVWTVDGLEMGDLEGANSVPAARTAKNSQWTVRAFYVDAKGNEGESAQASLTVLNTPPYATVSATPVEPLSDDDVSLIIDVVDADDDETSFTVDWLRNGTQAGLAGDLLPADLTSRGDVWTAVVTPADDEAPGEPVEVSVNIANKPPVATEVTLAPSDPTEASLLTGSAEGSDPDGDPVSWTYMWTVNEADVTGQTGDTLSGEHFNKADVVRFIAMPSDGFIAGEPVASDPVTVLNTPPTLASATVGPAVAYADTELTCTGAGFADIDGDSETLLMAWSVNGSVVSSSTTLGAGSASRGDAVLCTITPYDGEVEGAPVRSAPVVLLNSAPALASAAISPSTPTTTDGLSVTIGATSDPDGDPVSVGYRWTVDGKGAGTGATLAASAFSKGDAIIVTATPNDGFDTGVPVVSAAVTAVNTPPVISAVTLTPASPGTNSLVSASVSASDADGDPLTYAYTWSVDGKVVGATGSTLDGKTWFDKGDPISVSVVPNDGDDSGPAVSSSSITAVNTPPTLASAGLMPVSPREADTLTCSGVGFADDDGDSAAYRYAWTVGSTTVSGATSATLTGSSFNKADKVACQVTPFDGTDTGPAQTSPSRTVLNTAPVLTAVTLSPSSPKFGDTLTATATGVSDADSDAVTLQVGWYEGTKLLGTTTTTSTTSSFSAPAGLRKGEDMTVRVEPYDGTTLGTEVISSKVTVANTAPVIVSASVISPLYTSAAANSARSHGDVDPADSSLTESFAWTVNTKSAGGSGSTLASSTFKKGDSVAYTLTVSDGTATDSKAAVGLVVRNSPPTDPKLTLSPASPVDSADLICKVTTASTDADLDSLTYEFEWTHNTKVWAGSTGKSVYAGDLIDAVETLPTDKWSCSAYASDGTDDSKDAFSGTVTVSKEFPPKAGSRSRFGVTSGDPWTVCSATTTSAWMSADSSGTYNPTSICLAYGYDKLTSFGTMTTPCRTFTFDGKGGSSTKVIGTVHWRCDTGTKP